MIQKKFLRGVIVGVVLILLGLILWRDLSFLFGGIGVMVIGGAILYYINSKKQ